MSTDKKKSALPKGKISSADAKGNIRAEMAIDPALEARRPELTSPEAIGDVKKKLQDFQTSVTRLENMPGMFDDIPIGAPAAAAPAAAVAATPAVADDIPEVISGGDDQNKSEEPAEEEIVFPDTSAESVDGIATGLGDDEADDASDEVDAFADLNIPAAEETVAEEAPTATEEKTSGDFNFDDAEDLQDEPDPFAGIADTDDVPDVKAPEVSEMPEAASDDGDQEDDVFGDMTFNRVDEDDLTADLDDEDVAGDTFLGDLDDVDEDNRTHSETAPEWEAELAAAEAEVEVDQEADPEAAIEPDQDELPDAEDGDYDDGEIGDILSEMTQTDEDTSSEERIEAPDEGDFVWDQPEAVSEEAAEQDYSDFSNVPEMSEDADFVPEDVDAELFNEIDIATLSAPAVTDDVDDFEQSEELTQDDEPQVAVADDFEGDLTNDVTEGSEDDWFNEMISEDAEEVTPEEPAVMPEADVAAANEEPEATHDDVDDLFADAVEPDPITDESGEDLFPDDDAELAAEIEAKAVAEAEAMAEAAEEAAATESSASPKKRGFFSRLMGGKKAAADVTEAETDIAAVDDDAFMATSEVEEDPFADLTQESHTGPVTSEVEDDPFADVATTPETDVDAEPDPFADMPGNAEDSAVPAGDEEFDPFGDMDGEAETTIEADAEIEQEVFPQEGAAELPQEDTVISFEDIQDGHEETGTVDDAMNEDENLMEDDEAPAKKKSKAPLLAASVAALALFAGGGYLYTNPSVLDGLTGNTPAPVVVVEDVDPAPTLDEEQMADATTTVDDLPEDMKEFAAEDDGFGTGFGDDDSDNLEDMFLRDEATETVDLEPIDPEPEVDEIELARQAEIVGMQEELAAINDRLDAMDEAFELRDQGTIERDAILTEALDTANRAEALAQAQNAIIVEVIRAQDKIAIAEQLIVDLSRRVASVEMNDPADRVTVERTVLDLNQRVEGLARDVGLVARMTINGRTGTGAGAMTRPTNQSRPASRDAGAVFDEGQSTMTHPNASPSNVSADVKVGDNVEGYGKVLDLMATSDGGKLVIMEHGSVIIPD